MTEFIVTDERCECMWEHEGHVCAVLLEPRLLHRCGYVWVAPGSPLEGVEMFDDLLYGVDVHGGVTFSNWLSCGNPKGEAPDYFGWAFGFDCAHCDDAPDVEAGVKRYGDKEEYHSWYFDCFVLDDGMLGPIGIGLRHIWTLEEVVDETEHLCEQIAKLEHERR